MKYEVYSTANLSRDFSVVDFVSTGKNGPIPKRIAFTATELANVYNLELCNVDENGDLDDSQKSDNGDRNKILATVFYVVEAYTKKYPERYIIFRGNTRGRTRLYRMAVGLHLEELSNIFNIYAFVGEELVPFTKNMEINTFVIKRKKT